MCLLLLLLLLLLLRRSKGWDGWSTQYAWDEKKCSIY
jgi:hypothetical protein